VSPQTAVSVATDERVAKAASCHDAEGIPKVPTAGDVLTHPSGAAVQVMHNGIVVLADAYYNQATTAIIKALHGHHEPQEEWVFHEVLQAMRPEAVMVELGAYWSYYSLWFQHAVPGGVSYLVEPDADNLRCGQENFRLNGKCGTFLHALVGGRCDATTNPPTITVDHLVHREGLRRIDILHADIQGFEYQMLLGAENLLNGGGARFLFISTHGLLVHYRCLRHLRGKGLHIVASHTPPQSYSDDGLIVATTERNFPRVRISKKPVVMRLRLKSLLAPLAATAMRESLR
jgi:hypothetical protein